MHQSIHISYNNNCIQCDEFIIRAQNCKNTGGVRAHFLQKYERYTGRNTSAGKNCFFSNAITQFLDGPFNGLSGLFKLQFLSSDSFFYQLGSENFILARNYEKVRVRNHCWSNYTGENTKIQVVTGNFLKTPVHMGVPVFIRPGSPHCVFNIKPVIETLDLASSSAESSERLRVTACQLPGHLAHDQRCCYL